MVAANGNAASAEATLGGRVGAGGHLFLEEPAEEVAVGQFLAGGAVEPLREHGGRLVELQLGEAVLGVGAHRVPPST